MMTRGDTWGLVINESLSFGLPVLTTYSCVAGVCLIENGVNGYLVEADDVDMTRTYISKVLKDDMLRDKMSRNNFEKVRDFNFENMARTIFNYIKR